MSGFLERLQAQKRVEDAAAQRRSQEQSTAANARQVVEQRRLQEQPAADRSLQNSLVPQYAARVVDTGFRGARNDSYGLSLGGPMPGSDYYVDIAGRADGSVVIGSTVLNARDKNNPKKVDEAFEKALRHPREVNDGVGY